MKKNAVGHFEIYAADPGTLATFYTSLFDWSFASVPGMDYQFITTIDVDDKHVPKKPGGINGGMVKRPEGYSTSAWISYVTVDSVDKSVERAKSLGAKVTKGRTAVPGMGWFAMLIDPQGNQFAVWEADAAAK